MSVFDIACLAKRKKAPKPKRVYDFEYRITERKTATGRTYFTGEGVVDGELRTLTECRYNKESHERSAYFRSGYPEGSYAKYKPLYRLDKMYTYPGCTNSPPAQFSDPIKLKDIICAQINEQKNKANNLAYKKVVSQGRCKCRS